MSEAWDSQKVENTSTWGFWQAAPPHRRVGSCRYPPVQLDRPRTLGLLLGQAARTTAGVWTQVTHRPKHGAASTPLGEGGLSAAEN